MTERVRMNLAVMGGAGALYASLVREKQPIYYQCVAAKPKGWTLRQFIFPMMMTALSDKDESIVIAEGVEIINPWVSSEEPNVKVSPEILDKFGILANNS